MSKEHLTAEQIADGIAKNLSDNIALTLAESGLNLTDKNQKDITKAIRDEELTLTQAQRISTILEDQASFNNKLRISAMYSIEAIMSSLDPISDLSQKQRADVALKYLSMLKTVVPDQMFEAKVPVISSAPDEETFLAKSEWEDQAIAVHEHSVARNQKVVNEMEVLNADTKKSSGV